MFLQRMPGSELAQIDGSKLITKIQTRPEQLRQTLRLPGIFTNAKLSACLVLLGFTGTVIGAGPEHPSKRIDYAMAYLPSLHSVIMHGGWAPPDWVPTDETWKWDGHRWSRWIVAGSPAFAHHTMAFDSERNVLVICGRPTPAQGGEYQIWEFNHEAWSRKADIPVNQTARGDPKLTYDERRNRLLLYAAGAGGIAEVWELDGSNWRLIRSPHQPARCDDGCLCQYDAAIGKSVLIAEERTSPQLLAWDGREWGMAGGTGTQIWLWDGVDWVRLPGEQPPRAVWGGTAFDNTRHELILLTTRMETWALRGNRWTKVLPARTPEPSPNGFFAMAYDPYHRVSLFFGGESRTKEPEKDWVYPEATWIYDGQNWSLY
jgi:hypothetical protein